MWDDSRPDMGSRGVLRSRVMLADHDLCYFAETHFRSQRKRIGLRRADRWQHCLVIGKTGMGKSTILEHLIRSDIRAGAGLAVLDPHGDLARRIRAAIPDIRQQAVIWVDLADMQNGIPVNVLRDTVSHPYLIVSGILGAFKKVWGDSWGPRMEHILRHSLMALLPVPDATLFDVTRLLTDPEFRKRALWFVDEPQVKAFFRDEFDAYSKTFRQEAIAPILNKVGHFQANPFLRAIIGQPENRLRLREIIDAGKILLVNLSKGTVGEDSSALFGALLLSQIERAALSRADIPESERRPFYLFVDEFSSFATASFAGMLSESRKYGVSLTLGTQLIGQIDEDIRDAVFGNVGTLMVFQVSAEDADYLAKELAPSVKADDLIGLPRHHFYLKLMVDGQAMPPFSAITLPPSPSVTENKTDYGA